MFPNRPLLTGGRRPATAVSPTVDVTQFKSPRQAIHVIAAAVSWLAAVTSLLTPWIHLVQRTLHADVSPRHVLLTDERDGLDVTEAAPWSDVTELGPNGAVLLGIFGTGTSCAFLVLVVVMQPMAACFVWRATRYRVAAIGTWVAAVVCTTCTVVFFALVSVVIRPRMSHWRIGAVAAVVCVTCLWIQSFAIGCKATPVVLLSTHYAKQIHKV